MRSTITDLAAVRPAEPPHRDWTCRTAWQNTVLVSVIGSRLHGVATADSDWDEMAIFIEEPRHVFGHEQIENHVDRFDEDGAQLGVHQRASAQDYERTSYTLRKYIRLAAKGNPHALQPLYAPDDSVEINHVIGEQLRARRDELFGPEALRAFFGICNGELNRLKGARSKKTTRTELEEKYGYDTKSASHIIRVAHSGITMIEEGHMDFPIRDDVANLILGIRQGSHSYEEMLDEAEGWIRRLEESRDRHRERLDSHRVDRGAWGEWLWEAHRQWWKNQGHI